MTGFDGSHLQALQLRTSMGFPANALALADSAASFSSKSYDSMYCDPSTWPESSFRPPPVTIAHVKGVQGINDRIACAMTSQDKKKTLLGSALSNNQSLMSSLMLTAATRSLLASTWRNFKRSCNCLRVA